VITNLENIFFYSELHLKTKYSKKIVSPRRLMMDHV